MERFVFLPQDVQEHIVQFIVGRVANQWIKSQQVCVYDMIIWSQIVDQSILQHEKYKKHRIVGQAVCKQLCQQELKKILFPTEMYLERAYTIRNYMEMWNTPPRFWNQTIKKMEGRHLGRKDRNDPL